MNNEIQVLKPKIEDANEINLLIIEVFTKCVAPDYSQEGIDYFLSLCKTEKIIEKINEDPLILIAKIDKSIIGIIWTRNINHISRYFVNSDYQHKGVGKLLFNSLLSTIKTNHNEIKEILVNSSPCAVNTYKKIGFKNCDEEKIANGMKYIPMQYKIY